MMISHAIVQDIARVFLVLCIISVTAKSSHFGDTNQLNTDQEILDSSNGGLTPQQLEYLAQRLADYNQVPPLSLLGWDRFLKNPEVAKRQGRYRQCYFNPISCFKK